ncbi:hypothetical protein CDL12_25935 [Handroanthus impetiginosus]|uniref:SP-RING-type domain-containing protein n=1 Tax=Handroanthus impetiginosus TaxID=429701 RepID=A0A2G9G9A6_9LAMI|nr:hypothetical protein CDL12_25935 [Handroanthus impetiginosus]
MAGTAVTQAPVTGRLSNGGVGSSGGGWAPNNALNGSDLNAFRISAVIDRLSIHVNGHLKTVTAEFVNLCLSLSRGIDFALANNEVPSRSQELPSLLKKVCQIKNDPPLEAAIMVLMISIKSACQSGWFSDEDSAELLNLAKEIGSKFCDASFNSEPSSSLSVISTIMSRFYPRMKMGHILAFLEIKPGFDAYLIDFQISKSLKSSPGDKIRLFVVQTDDIETSSCLVSPAKVNFMLNGKPVERRTNPYMEPGPQLPTVVTHMLKFGSNLLQAVGEFNGNYIVAVAFMRDMPIPDSSALQDYEHHVPASVDPDSEIIEGPSRISLNCPMSFRRVKTPVKGHSCKHIQCFDFDNYVDMNSRRPSWRCPHCNQHVCFTDVRIDQNMLKILKEVGANVSVITVSSDGSWSAVMESEETIQKPEDNTLNPEQDDSHQPADVLDLTQNDDAMDAVAAYETEDRKQFPNLHGGQFVTQTTVVNPHMANTNDVTQDDFWSGIHMPTFGLVSPNVRSNAQIGSFSASTSVLADSFTSPSTNAEAFHGSALVATSVPQGETSLPNTMQTQQYQIGNPAITNEYGRFPSVPRHITRTPVAIQALPARTSNSVIQQNPRNSANTIIANGLSAASHASPATPNFPATHRSNPHPVSSMSSSPLLQHPRLQQSSSFPSARSPQQNSGFQDPNQVPSMYRFSNDRDSTSPQMANLRPLQPMSQSPGLGPSSIQSPGSFLRAQNHVGVSQERSVHRTGVASTHQAQLIAAANRTVQMAVDPSRTTLSFSRNTDGRSMSSVDDQRGNIGVASQPVTRTDAYDPADMNWRPAGRMRGALSGQAYADALNQFIIRPTQQAQAARPTMNVANVAAQLQAFMATPATTNPSAGPSTRPVGSDLVPDGSSWMG